MIKFEILIDLKSGSRMLPNPGKQFNLQLAGDVYSEVETQRDKEGISFTRKAMMGLVMALNLSGLSF